MKLKASVVSVVVFLALVPAFLTSLVVVSEVRTLNLHTIENQLESLAVVQENNVNNILLGYQNRLKGVTSRTKFRNLLTQYNETYDASLVPQIEAILLDAIEPFDDLHKIELFDSEGGQIFVYSDVDESEQIEENTRFSFTKDFAYSEFERLIYVRGLIERDGEQLGHLVLGYSEDVILQSVQDYRGLGETGESLLGYKNDYGEAVFIHERRFEEDEFSSQTISMASTQVPIVQALLKNEDVFHSFTDYRGKEVLAATRYVDISGWGIVVKMDEAELKSGVTEFVFFLWLIQVVILILVILIALVLTRFITVPIYRLTQLAHRISNGNLDVPFPRKLTSRTDEIGVLANTMKEMTYSVRNSQEDLEKKVKERTKELKREKKRTEAHAQDLEKFKKAMDTTSEEIVITNHDGIVIYANKAVEKKTGYKISEAIGTKAGELWGGLMKKSYYKRLWKTIKEDKVTFVDEILRRKKNGEIYEAQISISPVLDDKGRLQFFTAVFRDISKEKTVDRMKTEFISLASHQLRTPISAIRWISEMFLEGDIGKITKVQKEHIQAIYDSNDRMGDLVNALLNISRIESGRIIVSPEPTDLNALVKGVLKELEPEMKKYGHSCVVSVNEKIGKVKLDKHMIHEVFKNYLSNAIKYTPAGGEISVFVSEKDKEVICQVSDNGYGVPLDQQERLFTKFFRADNIQSIETDGTGLGLYLVKAIVESSGGRVWYRGGEGKGSSFFFSLPKRGMKKKKGEVRLS